MTLEIALVFGIIAVALYLFASQKVPLDITAIGILVTLMAIPLVGEWTGLAAAGVDLSGAFPTVQEGLSGLSNPATVTVLAMFILSSGVQRSGLIHVIGHRVLPFVGNSEMRLLLVVAVLIGVLSGVINNTAAVAVAIPFILDLCRRLDLQASRMLIPLSFFGMLGGMLTLIGTSTSILASTILAEETAFGRNIGMFEFTHLGAIVLATGLVYFLTVGRLLLPVRDTVRLTGEDDEEFVVEVEVPGDSPLVGEPLGSGGVIASAGVTVTKLVRGRQGHEENAATMTAAAEDIVHVRGTVRQIMDLIASDDVDVLSDIGERRVARGDGSLVRVLLRNRHRFNGGTAGTIGFWQRYRTRLIGLETARLSSRRLADERLHVGEICLVEASQTALARLRRHPDLVLLAEHTDDFERRHMWIAGVTMLAVVVLAAVTPLPIVVTALMGVVVMAATGGITAEDLYSGVPWEVIFLLAGVIPLGIAMTKSGGAAWLGELLAANAVAWHPIIVLMVIYAVTTLLTELVSNNASVVILVPVAVTLASQLALPTLPVVLAVMFAASTSFLSPVGYQTNAMIYGTGLYRFTDFAKVGAPLNVLLMVVTSVSIWALWIP